LSRCSGAPRHRHRLARAVDRRTSRASRLSSSFFRLVDQRRLERDRGLLLDLEQDVA
jgi:hypothetical protein